MISVYFLFLSLLCGALSPASHAQTSVACAGPAECYPFEYCWNSICRELPLALRGDSVPGYHYTAPRDGALDLGGDDAGDDPIAGIDTLCRSDSDCMVGNRCEAGRCRVDVCTSDTQCEYQEICSRPRRRAVEGSCLRVACTAHYHCGEGHRCRANQCR